MRGGGSGGDGRIVELLQPLRKWHRAPRPLDRMGAADSGGWSSATTPLCPFLTQNSDVSPCLSGLLGLTSSRSSSISPLPRALCKQPARVVFDRHYLIVGVDVVSSE